MVQFYGVLYEFEDDMIVILMHGVVCHRIEGRNENS